MVQAVGLGDHGEAGAGNEGERERVQRVALHDLVGAVIAVSWKMFFFKLHLPMNESSLGPSVTFNWLGKILLNCSEFL